MTTITNLKKYIKVLSLALIIGLVTTEKAFAAGGYGHEPEPTSIAGFTDQASIAFGVSSYILGSTIMASSKIVKSLINKG